MEGGEEGGDPKWLRSQEDGISTFYYETLKCFVFWLLTYGGKTCITPWFMVPVSLSHLCLQSPGKLTNDSMNYLNSEKKYWLTIEFSKCPELTQSTWVAVEQIEFPPPLQNMCPAFQNLGPTQQGSNSWDCSSMSMPFFPGTNSALVSIKCMPQHAMGLGPLWSTDNKLSLEKTYPGKTMRYRLIKAHKIVDSKWLLLPLHGTEINSHPKNIPIEETRKPLF